MTTTTVSSKLALRTRVAIKRDALTRELATGAPPELSPELGLRAAQLVNPRARRQAASALRGTLKDAHELPVTRAYFSLIRPGAVIDAEDAIDALIDRLTSDQPVAARGMASVHRLMTDGTESPLYAAADPGSLRRQIVLATEALDPEELNELPVAA